jgi:hypothetical protein
MKTCSPILAKFLATSALYLGVASLGYAAPEPPAGKPGKDVPAWPRRQAPGAPALTDTGSGRSAS